MIYSNSIKDCNCLLSYLAVVNSKIGFHFPAFYGIAVEYGRFINYKDIYVSPAGGGGYIVIPYIK
jgi:hypothetical protein